MTFLTTTSKMAATDEKLGSLVLGYLADYERNNRTRQVVILEQM